MMTVKLSSCGNPDFRQNPKDSLSPMMIVEVDSLQKASEVCSLYIGKWDLGGGNWNGGQVFAGDRQIARISYNGRIWDMTDKEIVCLNG